MSDYGKYGEGLSPEYKFSSAVPDFQNSVGAANAKTSRIERTCVKKISIASRIGCSCLLRRGFFRAYLMVHLQNRHRKSKIRRIGAYGGLVPIKQESSFC